MLDVMQRGGGFMWVIFVVSLVGLAVIIERAYVLYVRYRLDAAGLFAQIRTLLEEKRLSRAIEVCGLESGKPLAEVLKAGLLHADEPEADIQRAIEAATLRVLPDITRRVPHLAMLANVSTLLGLLGTIMGLIEAFRGVAQADAAAKQDILAKGIAVAMFTTAFGLIAAIPSLVAFSLFQGRQQVLVAEIETYATELFGDLVSRRRRTTGR